MQASFSSCMRLYVMFHPGTRHVYVVRASCAVAAVAMLPAKMAALPDWYLREFEQEGEPEVFFSTLWSPPETPDVRTGN